jgi:hypothetical protein
MRLLRRRCIPLAAATFELRLLARTRVRVFACRRCDHTECVLPRLGPLPSSLPFSGSKSFEFMLKPLIPSTPCGGNLPTRAAALSGPCRSIPERSSVNDDACTLRASRSASAAPLGLPAEAGSPAYRFTHHTNLVRRDYSRLAGPLEFAPLDPCRFSPSGRSSPTFSP